MVYSSVMFRRLARSGFSLSLAIVCVWGCGSGGSGTDGDPLTDGVAGCYAPAFSGAQAGQFGCGILNTSGDFAFDRAFADEIFLQSNFWMNIPATVWLFDECGPSSKNAYSHPSQYIMMGIWLANDVIITTQSTLPIAGVLAHEWGHQVQFQRGWMVQSEPTVRRTELEADMFSGLYVAWEKNWAGAEFDAYYQYLFQLGDYNFNDPGHHGTPNQRLAAGAVGMNVAEQLTTATYTELHEIFSTKVTEILATAFSTGGDTAVSTVSLSAGAQEIWDRMDHEWITGVLRGTRTLVERPALNLTDAERAQVSILDDEGPPSTTTTIEP